MELPAPISLAEFNERVRCICALLSCSETSGMRTTDRNAKVGGARRSKHLIGFGGLAKDIVPDENNAKMRQEVVRVGKLFGLWVEDEMDHVHLQGRAPG